MDSVLIDTVTTKVSDTLNLFNLSVDFNFIGFHSFLDGFTDVTKSDINTSGSDTGFSGILNSLQQHFVLWIEGDGEGRVNQPTVDVGSEIKFADISIF